jgi:hypothetical protein
MKRRNGTLRKDYREAARALIDDARRFLRTTAKQDPDGRHQRTYAKISGHYPAELARALRDRGQIDDDQFEAAANLFTVWNNFARGTAAKSMVPKKAYDTLAQLRKSLIKA